MRWSAAGRGGTDLGKCRTPGGMARELAASPVAVTQGGYCQGHILESVSFSNTEGLIL